MIVKIKRKIHIRTLLPVLLGIFLSASFTIGYFNSYVSPPIPPIDPKLKNFPIDLDLLDFAKRNLYPNEHCFFPVKGRKDIVEYIPNQQEGMYIFPTGACQLDDDTCSLGKRKGHLPGWKKTDPPLYAPSGDSRHLGFAVIPYRYVDDIDFSTCMPTWTGYLESTMNIQPYVPPKRNYSKQSCYHPVRPLYANEKPKTIFCDSEKCQFDGNLYCEHKNGQCYKNGYPLKTKKGERVLDTENLGFINWDFCLNEAGALIPEDGGPPYEERFKAGCSYRITAPNYYEKQYAGNINFLVHCDENRCNHQELNFDMKRKEYLVGHEWSSQTYTKTPTLGEFPTIDWQCLDATKVRDYNKKLLCYNISSDEKNPDCRLCYENKKFIYKGCRIPYDELGRRTDIPKALRSLNFEEEMKRMDATIRSLKADYDIPLELGMWFSDFINVLSVISSNSDELERQRMAGIAAEFNELQNHVEKDVEKLKRRLAPFITEQIQTTINNNRKRDRPHMCNVCQSAAEESFKREIIYREACSICKSD